MASSTQKALLKKRSVVSSFIIKRLTNELGHTQTKVALFKRSGKVNTYRHHWAPISGSIEPGKDASPLAAAWRELHEETTLTDSTLELLRHGKSYVFADPSVGREWTIYPFLYRLKGEPKDVTIDWEHDEWAWFDPADVKDTPAFGGVPNLAKSLRRVWFEYDLGRAPGSAGALLAAGLDMLKNDHQSGARQLASIALGLLRDVIGVMPAADTDVDAWWAQVRFVAWHIWKNGRESMGAAIMSALVDALATIEDVMESGSGVLAVRNAAVNVLEEKIGARVSSSSAKPVTDALLGYLEQNYASAPSLSILTLSESSTIAYFLQQLVAKPLAAFKSIDVRVLESRPLFEGVSLAASLVRYIQENRDASPGAATPVKATVYTDASMAMAAEGVDIVLLGADRIASTGAVSNKTGSLPAVLCAKHVSSLTLPSSPPSPPSSLRSLSLVIILGETEKIASPGDPRAHVVEDNDPAQVSRDWHCTFNSARVQAAAAALDLNKQDKQGGGRGNKEANAASRVAGQAAVEVHVRNVYFEWVPPELVDVYVTEKGVWSLQDIEQHSRVLGQEEERFFGDL